MHRKRRRTFISTVDRMVLTMKTLPALLICTASLFAQGTGPARGFCGADPTGVADSTAAFQTCIGNYPNGNVPIIPYGTYKITASLTKTRRQSLIGSGAAGTILNCPPSIPCIVSADTGSPNNYVESRIEDLTLQGTGTGIGVYIGGDPAGVYSAYGAFGDGTDLKDVRITGFSQGVQWGNNTWGNRILHSLIFANGNGLYAPSGLNGSGEQIVLTDSAIFNGGWAIYDAGGFEWNVKGCSFDYNYGLLWTTSSKLRVSESHIEQNGGQVIFQPYGYADLSIRDSTILIQASSGYDQWMFQLWPQANTFSLDNVSIWSNHAIGYLLRGNGGSPGAESGIVANLHGNSNGKIGAFSDQPTSLAFSGSIWSH